MSKLWIRWGFRSMQGLVLASVLWSVVFHDSLWILSPSILFGLLSVALCIWMGLRLFSVPLDALPRRGRGRDLVPPLSLASPWMWSLVSLPLLVAILQTVPLPAWVVGLLSPNRLVLARHLSQGLPELKSGFLTLSVDPDASRGALPFLLFPLMAFVLGNCLASSRERARGIALLLICLALAEGLYGLFEQLSGHRCILWMPYQGNHARGTFLNYNHFAATLSLFLPVTIGWFFFRVSEGIYHPDQESLLPPTSWDILNSRRGFWLFAPVILVLGIIQSYSRGAASSMIFGLALFSVLGLRNRIARASGVTGIVLALAMLAYAITSDYQTVFNRFEKLGEKGKNTRVIVWQNSLEMLGDYPLLGIGLGNFANSYRRYEKEYSDFVPYQAHNEWLEGMLTFGIFGMCPLLAALVLCFIKAYRIIGHAGRDQPWLLGVWCGLLGLALHSFVEFTFHSPGIIITASLLMGLLLGFERLIR